MAMLEKTYKRYCPDCRHRMDLVKLDKQPLEIPWRSTTDKNLEQLTFSEIWNCLNCNELWEFDPETQKWKIKSQLII